MQYLDRDGAPFSEELWKRIDKTVNSMAAKVLTGRQFLPLNGPVGGGTQFAKIVRGKSEEFADWYVKTTNQQVVEIPQLFSDFWLYWRDYETGGDAMELSSAMTAAQKLARHEDEMIYYGIADMGLEGILTAKGTASQKKGDWSKDEAAYADVAAAVNTLEKNSRFGEHVLVVSADIYTQLQRIQPGTGLLESQRIEKLIGNDIIKSTALKAGTAFLICAEPNCIDLLIGQDITTGFTEAVDMNYHLRIMETALLRIKTPDAIVVFK
jgi:uncharacterized linocin/CFP29 family protein